jgi:UDP-N-acetylglucosamine acyltransferase
VHQFSRIGGVVMIAGGARITCDVPPFCMVAERDYLSGLNLVGIKRREWPREAIRELKDVYRQLMKPTGNLRTAAAALLEGATSAQVRTFLEFFAGGKRGFARPVETRGGATEISS